MCVEIMVMTNETVDRPIIPNITERIYLFSVKCVQCNNVWFCFFFKYVYWSVNRSRMWVKLNFSFLFTECWFNIFLMIRLFCNLVLMHDIDKIMSFLKTLDTEKNFLNLSILSQYHKTKICQIVLWGNCDRNRIRDNFF